jgi:plasmid stability protein
MTVGKIEVDRVEDRVIAGIAAEARLHGRSFEEQVRAILAPHAVLSRDERPKLIDEIRAMTPKGVRQTDSTETIRALRDANYNFD